MALPLCSWDMKDKGKPSLCSLCFFLFKGSNNSKVAYFSQGPQRYSLWPRARSFDNISFSFWDCWDMTCAMHLTGLQKHLSYVLQFCNAWCLLACSRNKLVISVPFPSHSLLQDLLSSHRTRRLVLSHIEKNYSQKNIFLVSWKFSLQIFWPKAIENIFLQCSADWGFFYSLEVSEVWGFCCWFSFGLFFIFLFCAKLPGRLKFPW